MNTEIFKDMREPELRKYIEFLLFNYRVMDAFWFIYITEQFNLKTAEGLNEKVWARVSGMAAKDLIPRFNIKEKGLVGFSKAIRLFPWCILTPFEIEEKKDEILINIPHCAPQEARIRNGVGEFACKEMHRGEFVNFAREVDPEIKVECLFAPPDPHPKELFCQWRISMGKE